MNGQFITNQDRFLSQVINNILPSSQKLFFLVGYFYFSGFKELYQQLADKEVKILLGLDIEKALGNKIKEFEILQSLSTARGKLKDNYKKSLVQLFNDTDYFDSEEKQEAFRLFLEKIKDGSLEIRKTLQPNHAKVYIFENKKEHSQGGEFPGTVITGSSNLTMSGLRGRQEVNVIFRDSATYKEAKVLFDSLWQNSNSVEIVSKHNIDEFLSDVVENIWLDKLPKPFLLYVRVIDEYFSTKKDRDVKLPADITGGKFLNLKYQIDAIQKALEIISRHDGVIVADVAGLGKSIIASAMAHNLRFKTIVITPPHLEEQWDDYRYDFDFNAKIYTSGKIEQALSENDDAEQKLIIVDEAHKYRNELTNDYANLHKLCQGNKVVLLSATPFNNKPQDIFSMIKLFQIPTKSTIRTIDNLSYSFKELVKEYKDIQKSQREELEDENTIKARIQSLASQIREILFPLVIRRSRLDLKAIEEYKKDLDAQGIEFPKVEPPQMLDYDLGDLSELYEWTLETIAPEDEEKGFKGARYKPVAYLKNFEKYRQKIEQEFGDTELFKQSQRNLAKFMKLLLVKRFESSVMAFSKSLDSLIISSEQIKDWYEKVGKVPIYKKGNLPDLDTLLESSGEEAEERIEDFSFDEQLKRHRERGLEFIEKKELKKSFIKDLNEDIALLKRIRNKWFADGIKRDPKLVGFTKEIKEQLENDPERKVVVFSEFSDTADYLYNSLKKKLRVFKYTSGDASKAAKETIKTNFDASLPKGEQKDDFDILIATDAISEGYNLHRAGTVFNYDIPYNPTRVIQRVGRINRVTQKVFDPLYIYNFFPTVTGEIEIRTKQISTLKLAMIHALLGEDTRVLTSEEELVSFFRRKYIEAERNQEELSWDVDYLNLLNSLRNKNPEIIEEAKNLPRRVRIKRTAKKKQKGVVVFGKKGEEYTFKIGVNAKEYESLSPLEALQIFEAELSEKSQQVSKSFEPVYQKVKENLFTSRTEVPYSRGRADALAKVDVLLEKLPRKRDYLEDLKFVLQNLDALPEQFAKKIRAISDKNLEEQVEEFQKEVSHKYLVELREKANRIDEGEEVLILAEELA